MIKLFDIHSQSSVDFAAMKAQGFSGVIMKAGQGKIGDIPIAFPDYYQRARDAGLAIGWYWVSDSRIHSSDHIKMMEKMKIFDNIPELGLQIDVEKPYYLMKDVEYWKTPYCGWRNVVDLVYLCSLRTKNLGIYTAPGPFKLILAGAPKEKIDWLAQFPLWTAQYYGAFYIEGISKPSLYGSWKSWRYWQWRENPDYNNFNGTDADWQALIGGGDVVVNPPPRATEKQVVDFKMISATYDLTYSDGTHEQVVKS